MRRPLPWVDSLLAALAAHEAWSYHSAGPAATEPAALAALALLGHDRIDEAHRPLHWLVQAQGADGSLGVTAKEKQPNWPTSLAVIAWSAADRITATHRFQSLTDQSVEWLLSERGKTTPRNHDTGHDTTLVGWPWVDGTHSWVEPTAWAAIALAAAGRADHPRRLEALRLLADRLLPSGGCNYGNTLVLNQELLPHVQPSGMAMLALAGFDSKLNSRIEASIRYLKLAVPQRLPTVSLSFGLLGLAAQGEWPERAPHWLQAAAERDARRGTSAYKQALLALVALAGDNPLLTKPERAEHQLVGAT